VGAVREAEPKVFLCRLYGLKFENLITSVIVFWTCALIIWTVP
jgi:hypothetical protein